MPSVSALPLRRPLRLALLAVVLVSSGPSEALESVFAGFAGAWTGSGTVTMANGDLRRLACSSTYVIGATGTTLEQSLDCTSDGVRLQLSASYIYANDGAVSGNWSETTRGARGRRLRRWARYERERASAEPDLASAGRE